MHVGFMLGMHVESCPLKLHVGNACGTTRPYEIACCTCMWHSRGNVDIHPLCFPSKQADKGETQSTLH